MSYCRWFDKDMSDVTEHEYDSCIEIGRDCCNCEEIEDEQTPGKESF